MNKIVYWLLGTFPRPIVIFGLSIIAMLVSFLFVIIIAVVIKAIMTTPQILIVASGVTFFVAASWLINDMLPKREKKD